VSDLTGVQPGAPIISILMLIAFVLCGEVSVVPSAVGEIVQADLDYFWECETRLEFCRVCQTSVVRVHRRREKEKIFCKDG